ncbi:MAG: tripartite tricarboxylate transporter substrate binding protein [Casimicrobiaceae bacterium]
MSAFFKSLGAAVIAGAFLLPSSATAQTFPSKPIHFVVAFTAGSATDIIARVVGDTLAKSLGQPVVIDNKPGAGGTIAAAFVAKAEPDGYTYLVHSAGHAVNPAIYSNLTYDTLKDFSGVSTLANLPNVLVVPPGKYKTVAELVAAAKANPGKLNFGSAGAGSATHMNAEKFRAVAGFDAVHVPFKGTPEALSETMAGRLDFFFAPIVSALQLVKEGKLTALAVGTAKRAALLPDVPSTVELGYAASDFNFWIGLLAPAKTPREIVNRMNQEVIKALQSSEVRERFATLGAEPFPMKPAEFDAYVKSEVALNAGIVKAAGIKVN